MPSVFGFGGVKLLDESDSVVFTRDQAHGSVTFVQIYDEYESITGKIRRTFLGWRASCEITLINRSDETVALIKRLRNMLNRNGSITVCPRYVGGYNNVELTHCLLDETLEFEDQSADGGVQTGSVAFRSGVLVSRLPFVSSDQGENTLTTHAGAVLIDHAGIQLIGWY